MFGVLSKRMKSKWLHLHDTKLLINSLMQMYLHQLWFRIKRRVLGISDKNGGCAGLLDYVNYRLTFKPIFYTKVEPN